MRHLFNQTEFNFASLSGMGEGKGLPVCFLIDLRGRQRTKGIVAEFVEVENNSGSFPGTSQRILNSVW